MNFIVIPFIHIFHCGVRAIDFVSNVSSTQAAMCGCVFSSFQADTRLFGE